MSEENERPILPKGYKLIDLLQCLEKFVVDSVHLFDLSLGSLDSGIPAGERGHVALLVVDICLVTVLVVRHYTN